MIYKCMQNSKKIVAQTGYLSRLYLEEKELKLYSTQIEHILNYIEKLKELNIEHVQPTFHALELKNYLRTDEPKESLPVDKVLQNAPEKNGNFFTVPKVY